MKEQLQKYADEVVQDNLGSIFGVRRGKENGPVVMVAGHMDEVGFMVTSITDNGLIRFQTLGGWWSQVLLAQRVQIWTDNGPVAGVVSSIPPHLLYEAQKSKPMDIKNRSISVRIPGKMRKKSGSGRGRRSCRSALSPRWPTRKKSLPRRGTTDTAAA
ncbi:hypothetical protein BpJC7_07030 [Weizmannia acidilactici]|uniref:Uncharacterized protein n=1 Tax=Weizmannia acidilactici TaxID=2607726 RepID=A0A5J4JFZ2_9BACI|nr:hypothetical protein BpJC4_09250 [Weizmannia acidilactici]GER69400.1 hypothetical protein BpJC7_07030 [Weizmannia acidilactici]GER72272.1 hypothetical protein BpPP18_03390 [Weizmannia acidilactici]